MISMKIVRAMYTLLTIFESFAYSSQIRPLESFRQLEFVLMLIQSLAKYRYIYRKKNGFVSSSCVFCQLEADELLKHLLTFGTSYGFRTGCFILDHGYVHKVWVASALSYYIFATLCCKY
jgi:hypothetical protein